MEQLGNTAHAALRRLLDGQPTTAAKVAFAWRMAVGAAVDRATQADWRPDGVLVVRSRGEAWRRELKEARPLLLRRLQDLLGRDVVARLEVE